MAERRLTPIPAEARPYQGQRAGVVTRVAAASIDALVVTVVQLLFYAGLVALLFLVDPQSFSFPDPSLLLGLATWFGILIVYLTLAWWASGRTYGNLVMGLRVVAYTGRNMRLIGALLRAAGYAVFPIGLLWCAVNRENRSIQDVVLRTSVVYDWQPRSPSRRGGAAAQGPPALPPS